MTSPSHSRTSDPRLGEKPRGYGVLAVLGILTALLGADAAGAPARQAPPRKTTTSFIESSRESIKHSLADALTHTSTPQSTVAMIKRLSEERRTAHRVIGAQFPLTDFEGIVLTDSYDESYVAAIDSLCGVYLKKDNTLPSAEAGAYLSGVLTDLPPISKAPEAFVVAFVIARSVQALLNIPPGTPTETRADLPEVVVRFVREFTSQYLSRSGFVEKDSSPLEIWHASVLERVRCPTHRTPYRLKEERNGRRADGSFYRRYVVICESGAETRNLDFDLDALTGVSRTGGRQQLPPSLERPTSRQPGVEQ